MKRVQAFWLAVGIAVGAHAWVLTDWGSGGGSVQLRPSQGQASRGVHLRWISLPEAPAPGLVATPQPPLTPPLADDATSVGRAEAESIATAPEPVPDATHAEHFWLPTEVDFRALPLHPPDTAPLDAQPWAPDQPVRLRLSINARGQVVDVASRDATPPPTEVLNAFATMFKATPFLPARRHGQDVASLQDIEILPGCNDSAPCSAP